MPRRHPHPRRRAVLALALLGATTARSAGPDFDSAVMVELGYKMDIVAQSMRYDYESWTLFSDGSVYKALPATALADFDRAASRAKRPADWGEWRRDGQRLEVRWPNVPKADAWAVVRKWFALTVLQPGQTLEASYAVLDASSQGNAYTSTFATGWKELRFHADGRFEQTAGGSVSSSQGNGSVFAGEKRASSGRYRITGPTLELAFEDGRTLRASLFFSSSDRKTMLLNGARLRRRP